MQIQNKTKWIPEVDAVISKKNNQVTERVSLP
jgi:hypothetical protein